MASRRPRKSAPRRRAPSARKRTPRKRARPRPRSRTRRKTARKKHSLLFILSFWPFLLVNRLTANWPAFLRYPGRVGGHCAVGAFLVLLLGAAVYLTRSLRYDLARVAEMPERTIIFDRKKRELGRLHGANRYVVALSDVSPNFRNALLAREDKAFRKHFGVDPRGMIRAVVQNVKRKRFAQGASTLTMQLARNAFNLPNDGPWYKQLDRKFVELALAVRIEGRYKKDEILQHYMNLIFWGGSIHGVEAAAQTYLEKPARELSLSEGAMLAGIIRAPNAFSPFENLTKTERERDDTLDSMVRYGFITEAESLAAKREPLHIRPPDRRISHDSYAMDAIRRDLELILEKENIKLGGLEIVTTIDKDLQSYGERYLDKRLRVIERQTGYRHPTRASWQALSPDRRGDPNYLQGAIVMIENVSGAVLAVVGGRDADESKFNRALHARRQLGSVFKPFVYLAAFDQGLRPNTWISDNHLQPGEVTYAPKDWHPQNSDGKYYKIVPVKDALIQSRNTSSIRVGDFAGMSNVADVAKMAGFKKKIPKMPASYLGAWEATPWEVASSYTLFPNGGTRYRPFLIQEIRDRDGKVLYRTDPLGYQAARTGAAWEVSEVLQDVTTRGTASEMRTRHDFKKPAGGKTGTTDNYQDAWFVGYSSSVTTAVWIGLDQPKRIMPSGYGAALALPVWVDVMKAADRLQRYEFGQMKAPVKTVPCRLCRYSAKRATPGCEHAETAYNDKVPADLAPAGNDYCTNHPLRAVPVDETTPPRAQLVPPNRRPLKAIPVD